MKKLLVVVDVQNDFITGALGSQRAIAVLPCIRREISLRMSEGWEVAYTRDSHGRNYLSTQEGRRLPVPHCIENTPGGDIVENIYVGGKIFNKASFGCCELGEYVRDNGYTDVEFIGVCTDICVISNALLVKAYAPEVNISVKAEACAGVSEESHQTALNAMRACQVDII